MARARLVLALCLAFAACDSVSVLDAVDAAGCFRSRVNQERTARKIPKLKNSDDMNKIASQHSEEMAAQGTIYHNENLPNEEGVKPFLALGENVGMGSSCEIIHEALMDSPGHKANILDRDYLDLGIGVDERDGRLYLTQIFHTPGAPASKPPATTPTKKPAPKCTCP